MSNEVFEDNPSGIIVIVFTRYALWFYILIRYMATVVFGYMAYSYYQNNKKELAVASGALAILFQPFVKLALGRCVWNFVDIVVAIGLIITVLLTNQEK